MLPSHFFANLARMKLIYRWPLMRNIQPENIAEHSLQVAMVAHALGIIKNRLFGGNVNADRAAVMALYHDSSEVLTGDLPTPVKYFNPEIAREYKKIELAAEQRLLGMLPPELVEDFRPLLDSAAQDDELARLVKDADTLCAYTKCLEEINAGNREFEPARKRLEAMLAARMCDEMRYFIDTFVASFSLPLDELNAH
ncbi:5'-deoxynucleotidase [Aeromonas veronii]|uniref:5'-deoxynucleotidase n=1 Tax=Aeromonas veronii TaxID=654 RepID=UPI0013E018D8|nr:5'-deoxynucleotidase [Aeromonas veronii]MBL0640678.1 5'-deoxynucleotidase [Aeromonas veronii]QIF44248.1 5'-deoxynucleotidase [Aeromonas veronii]